MGQPLFNNAGQIAFWGRITGPDVITANEDGIWATDRDGKLNLLRKGDLFDVNDDPLIQDLRTIQSLVLTVDTGNENGRATPFNDAGELAFILNFTDGTSGIFVATIPEPTTLGFLGVGAGLVAGRRGKRVA
ncbi:MAG: PEP-CTERM sorting domain-containing protein [Phycisphaerales bacterium]